VRLPERIRAQLVRQAVERNLDEIQDRLPTPLRPLRRRAQMKAGLRVALPVAAILAVLGVARSPTKVPDAPVTRGRTTAPAATRSGGTGAGASASVLSQSVPPGVLALSVRRVIIDAGHGGESLGTTSAGGLLEKDLTLDIAERVRRLMVARGFEAVMTRRTDETVSLQQRAAIANGRRGDIFVSIHLNSLERASVRGIETYYLGPSDGPEHDAIAARENQHSGYSLSDLRSLLEKIFTDARRDESRRLAHTVQRALVQAMRKTDPTLRDRGVKMAPFVVLVATEMPAILAEVSCLSNAEEAARLSSPGYRERIAQALVTGVTTFARTNG
jgi:N-acetylmuramoyl-L-alanine amidase